MKIGLIGLPRCGKTTLFNAITRSQAQLSAYAGARAEPNVAVVHVRDPRVEKLTEHWKPKKTVLSTIEFMDFPGVEGGSAKDGAFTSSKLADIRTADALAIVARNFKGDAGEAPVPIKDIETISEEMLLADLVQVDNRLQKIEWAYRRGQKTPVLEAEEKLLQKIKARLEAMQPIRGLALSADEFKASRGFRFLTEKPWIAFVNSSEDLFRKSEAMVKTIDAKTPAIEFAGTFEMDLSRIEDESEAKMFLEDMGLTESARDRLVHFASKVVGQINFFTVGEDEVRAWNILQGDTAVDAAGTIHTDLARGFIRAEVYSYDDWVELGSEKKVKEAGKFRLEGKEYPVKDGDIITIRFSV